MTSRIISAFLVLLTLSACNATIEVGLEKTPTGTSIPQGTPDPGATFTTSPVILPSATNPMSTETLVSTSLSTQHSVQIFLIAVDDNGQTGTPIGCGDSAIPVQVEIQPTQGVLKAALEALLAIKDQYYGESGLYNALNQSDLQVDTVTIEGGKASVSLTGTLTMGGECDIPRVQAQLEQTVLQFSTVTEAAIFINGRPLAEVLSLK